ncbi:hypothetical protein ACLI09_07010 [Flavobacterium sp. RHBU_24]|uniref:hypothetical protein n=1 Tax=Flavobacterium sp. RHBU_24 TaxID=3391185 RepID=UPI003984B8F8
MKKHLLLLLTVLPLLALSGCNNDDDNKPADPISQLPPATQTGEDTFGCLLDGKAFLPGPGLNTLDCVYQYVDGGYYFALQGNKRDSSHNYILIGCCTQKLEIFEGEEFDLKEQVDGNAYGSYFYNLNDNTTSITSTGKLKITKLDFTNHIVSGTFWFDVMDENGVVHQIREGRFDMHFTT